MPKSQKHHVAKNILIYKIGECVHQGELWILRINQMHLDAYRWACVFAESWQPKRRREISLRLKKRCCGWGGGQEKIVFGGHRSGIRTKIKSSEWQFVFTAVNDMSMTGSSVPEVKNKWSDLKIEAKRILAYHHRSLSATCGSTGKPKATPLDKTKGFLGEEPLSPCTPLLGQTTIRCPKHEGFGSNTSGSCHSQIQFNL